ncbi:dual OB domain-containing protein [Lysinibacillus capsici]|uniref:dual OB domain-containing protein n=1 Tax=Lysinibacillus capsici TaxID=2115968 RepID=UPI0027A782A3|nr:hypothetical protein QIX46_23640 [Lysinibacillus boronitolerans]
MRCIVTGITEMSGTKVCMSLYSLEDKRYFRPLKNGYNFDISEILGIDLYSLVDVNPSGDELLMEYPHCEDLNIESPYFTFIREYTDKELYDFFTDTAYVDTKEMFGEGSLIKQGRTWGILSNTGKRSLGTVEVDYFEITKDTFNPEKPSYRVSFRDLSGELYSNIKFVIKALPSKKDEMLGEYEKEYEDDRLFLRLSLAREWNNGQWEDDMCVLQVSNFACFENKELVNL